MATNKTSPSPAIPFRKVPVAVVLLLTVISGGLYLPIWLLTRRAAFNQLHSEERLHKGTLVAALLAFGLALLLSLYAAYLTMPLAGATEPGQQLAATLLDLLANLLALLALVPLVYQTFRAKRMLADHFNHNDHLQRDIPFSNLWTLLLLNVYLQYKINQLTHS